MHRLSFRKSMCRNNKKKKPLFKLIKLKSTLTFLFFSRGQLLLSAFIAYPAFQRGWPVNLTSSSIFFFSFVSFLFLYECRAQKPCERLPFTFENAYKQSSLTEKKKRKPTTTEKQNKTKLRKKKTRFKQYQRETNHDLTTPSFGFGGG